MAVEQIRSWRGDCLVPVPLHPVRFRERGFNQAETLCRNLSRDTGLIVLTRAVKRIRVTRTQALLSRGERLANMRGAFAPAKMNLNDKRVVLVDDVLTTGATTNECASACLEGGCGGCLCLDAGPRAWLAKQLTTCLTWTIFQKHYRNSRPWMRKPSRVGWNRAAARPS